MIAYIANRDLEILGTASTNLDNKFVIMNDTRSEDVSSGSATLTFDLYHKISDAKEAQAIAGVGNYILIYNGQQGVYYAYEIIETDVNLIDNYINIYAEDAGLDLLNTIADPYYLNYDWVAHLFTTILNRQGTKKEITAYTRRLALGTMSDGEVVKGFITSNEYKQHPAANLDAYITLFYKAYLNRNPETSELTYWKNQYAAKKEQMIYCSKQAGTTEVSASTSWVEPPKSDKDSHGSWTTKKPAATAEYPVIFYAKQRLTNKDAIICTKPTTNASEDFNAQMDEQVRSLIMDGFANSPEFTRSEFKLNLGKHDIVYYVNKFISGTGFELGTNEIGTTLKKPLEWPEESTVTERLLRIAEDFDAEVYFTFKINKFTIENRYVNIVKRRGQDTRLELRLGREVSNIRMITSIASLMTAIKPIGGVPDKKYDPVTLYGYNYTDPDGDFYIDGEVLKSRKALERWARYAAKVNKGEGHITSIYNSEATTQEELFAEALQELKAKREPIVNCECEMLKVPDELRIGDKAYLIDDNSELYFQARILKMEISESSDSKTITLGDYLITNSGISDRMNAMAIEFARLAASRQFYTWIAYADDEYGNGISTNRDGKKYVGVSPNRLGVEPDISDPSAYTWTIITDEESKQLVEKKIEELEFGGRNLIQGTRDPKFRTTGTYSNKDFFLNSGGNGVGSVEEIADSPLQELNKTLRITNNTTGNRDFAQTIDDFAILRTEGQWVFSTYVRSVVSDTATALIRVYQKATSGSAKMKFSHSETVSKKWKRIIIRVNMSSDEGTDEIKIQFGLAGSGSIEYIGMKLERGTYPSDWTPAPEDDSDALVEFSTAITRTIEEMQDQIDGVIDTYYYNYEPTTSNYPANEWTTESLKNDHEGDMFLDTSTGKSYRWLLDGTWQWVEIPDTAAAQAMQIASEAKDTADGKRRVFTNTPYSPYDKGDLWCEGSTGDILTCVTAKAKGAAFNKNDWAKLNKYTDDTAVNNLVIGAVNLLPKAHIIKAASGTLDTSEYIKSGKIVYSRPAEKNCGFYLFNWASLEPDTEYIIRFKARQINDTSIDSIYIHSDQPANHAESSVYFDGASLGSVMQYLNVDMSDNNFHEFIIKFKTKPEMATGRYKGMICQFDKSVVVAYSVEVIELKLEKGNRATSWSPNPDDIDSEISDVTGYIDKEIETIQTQVDGKMESYYQATDPSTSWDADEKIEHTGDIWINSDQNGGSFRWNGTTWEVMKTQPPKSFVDTIDGKAQVFIVQPTPPYQKGDLWFKDNKSEILTCIVDRETGSYNKDDWAKMNKYVDDTALNANLVPNLSPFFSNTPYVKNKYWGPIANTITLTPKEDGWVHIQGDLVEAATRADFYVYYQDVIKPISDYTFLIECRNNNSQGTGGGSSIYIVEHNPRTNVQFFGNGTKEAIEGGIAKTATVSFGPTGLFPPGTEGVFKRRFVKTSEANEAPLNMIRFNLHRVANSSLDVEIRISVYEGRYTGPYKRYADFKSEAVQSADVEYYSSTSPTSLAGGSWGTNAPTWQEGRYIWERTKWTDASGNVSYSKATCLTGNTGPKGDSGVSINSVTEYYLASASSSGVTRETSGWSTSIQTPTKDKPYLWNYEITKGTDGSTLSTTDPVIIGTFGKNGMDGKGISKIEEFYKVNNSSSTAPTSWDTTPGTTSNTNRYLWNYEKITYTDGTSFSSKPAVIGSHGDSGISVTSVTEYYLASASSSGVTRSTSGWTTTIQTINKDKPYLWNYEVTKGSTGATLSTTDPIIIGTFGKDGTSGKDGKGISKIEEFYKVHNSNTTAPTSWDTTPGTTTNNSRYLWNYEKITYTDGTSSSTTPAIIGTHGDSGANATTYYLSSTAAAIVKTKTGTLSPTSITFTSNRAIGTGNPTAYAGRFIIQESTNGTNWTTKYTSSANESSKAYTPSANTVKFIKCTLYLAGGTTTSLDVTTVPIVSDGTDGAQGPAGAAGKDGTNGTNGTNGKDAYTVILTNESHTFAGGISAALNASTTSEIIAYKGATRVASAVTQSAITGIPTGMTVSVANSGTTSTKLTFTVNTSMVTKSGVVTIPVVVDGKTIDRKFTYSLALKGEKGNTGKSVKETIEVYYTSNNNSLPAEPTDIVVLNNKSRYNEWNLASASVTSTYKYIFTCTQSIFDDDTFVNGPVSSYGGLESANTVALDAKSTATTANTTANTAKTTATTAKNTADEAKSTATTANNTANAAKTAASTAQSTANTALTAANGKNKVFHQASAPSTTGCIVGDTWFDTANGYRMHKFDGTNWVEEKFSTAAISQLDAGIITAGTMSAARIKGGTLSLGGKSTTIGNGVLKVYDSKDNLVGILNTTGLHFEQIQSEENVDYIDISNAKISISKKYKYNDGTEKLYVAGSITSINDTDQAPLTLISRANGSQGEIVLNTPLLTFTNRNTYTDFRFCPIMGKKATFGERNWVQINLGNLSAQIGSYPVRIAMVTPRGITIPGLMATVVNESSTSVSITLARSSTSQLAEQTFDIFLIAVSSL